MELETANKLMEHLLKYNAVYSTFASIFVMLLTAIYVGFTYSLVKESRKSRSEMYRPNVVVDFDLLNGHFLHYSIKNLGNDTAHSVVVTISPPIIIGEKPLENINLESLAPGNEYRNVIGMVKIEDSSLGGNYDVQCNYQDSLNQSRESKRKFDFEIFKAWSMRKREYKEITDELAKITKNLTDISKSINSKQIADAIIKIEKKLK